MRIMIAKALLAVGASLAPSVADEPKEKRPTLAEELDRLVGTWRTEDRAEADVEVKFAKPKDGKVSVSQTWKKLGTSATGVGIRYEPKEESGARFLECPKAFADLGKYPQKVEFRFEKDVLVLKVAAGLFEGEHRLVKARDK